MKIIFILLFTFIQAISASELKTGDIILISFNCYECALIEDETDSNYSHSGVIQKKGNEVWVMHSLGNVHKLKLKDFLKYKRVNSQALILRAKTESILGGAIDDLRFEERFIQDFFGKSFDSIYSWDNFDKNGNEMYYCSEFVAKFLDEFLIEKSIPNPMSYNKHPDYWKKYFKGKVPEGELGNSPASFLRDSRFYKLGFLDD